MSIWETSMIIGTVFVGGILTTSYIFQKLLETAKLRNRDEL